MPQIQFPTITYSRHWGNKKFRQNIWKDKSEGKKIKVIDKVANSKKIWLKNNDSGERNYSGSREDINKKLEELKKEMQIMNAQPRKELEYIKSSK